MNDDAMEKLIEGVCYRLVEFLGGAKAAHSAKEQETLRRAIASLIITRVLSAFHAGELDEALDVVGRREWGWKIIDTDTPGEWENMVGWMAEMLDEGARRFIALRLLTGTGKEGISQRDLKGREEEDEGQD